MPPKGPSEKRIRDRESAKESWPSEWAALQEIFFFTDVDLGDVADLLLPAGKDKSPSEARFAKYKLFAKLMKWGKRIPLPAAAEAIIKRLHPNAEGVPYTGFIPSSEDDGVWQKRQIAAHRAAVERMAQTGEYDVWFNPLAPSENPGELPPTSNEPIPITSSDDDDELDARIAKLFEEQLAKETYNSEDEEFPWSGDDEAVLDEIEKEREHKES